jgi:hypothetical protein
MGPSEQPSSPPRCTATTVDAGQCELIGPHDGKPHAVGTPQAVLCWDRIQVERWSMYELPQWIRRLPWMPDRQLTQHPGDDGSWTDNPFLS